MTGLGSMYAIVEMNKRTEGTLFSVRSELFRIGGIPDKLSVLRQGSLLSMTYHNQTLHADPHDLLIVLNNTASGLDEADIWNLSNKLLSQPQRQISQKNKWAIGIIVSTIILSILLFITAG
ncbi:MAG: hypothetical protein U9R69_06855 [Thermodesulfobacteriota bacterium]|nr:hypothetical protein [Thermodesulfobacteriota bacterium]